MCVYSSAAVDVIVDVTAAFSTGGQLEYLPATPQRLVDTRTSHVVAAGGEIAFDVPSPGATADAVSVNVTATGHETDGFTTAFSCGTAVPEVSTLNQRVGEANANGAIVPVGTDPSTGCVFTSIGDEPDRRPQRLVGPRQLSAAAASTASVLRRALPFRKSIERVTVAATKRSSRGSAMNRATASSGAGEPDRTASSVAATLVFTAWAWTMNAVVPSSSASRWSASP